MSNWEAMFFELLDAVEQIPHPMAEEAWAYYNKLGEEASDGSQTTDTN